MIVHKAVHIPKYILWELLNFLLYPIHRTLNMPHLSKASYTNLEYLDLEHPKFDVSAVENLWDLYGNRDNDRKMDAALIIKRRRRLRNHRSRIKDV